MSFSLARADTGDAIEAVEREVSPLLARHSNALYLGLLVLFMPASPTSMPAVTRSAFRPSRRACSTAIIPASCARAALEKPAQERLAAINERLASLGTQFGQNVLADEKSYALVLEENDLAGLPISRARRRALRRTSAGIPENTSSHCRVPRLSRSCKFSARRDLRERFSRPGSSAARTAGKPTTVRRSPRWWVCAASARNCWASRASPITGSRTRWRRRRPTRANCSTKCGAARAPRLRPSAMRCRA